MNQSKNKIRNPILPGFHPDPSICRVENDFYLACSSFSFYPGIPLYHSRDLVHWEAIGYALNRPEQLTLNPDNLSQGLYAPTLRYHEGKFYLIVGNVSTGENILVETENPAGDWSPKHLIEGIGGDPSLFWDEDGRCWCTYNDDKVKIRELNLETYQLEGEEYPIWSGTTVGAWCPEGSHLYKKDGWYYLITAEGGTEHYHSVCVARSRSVTGPYEGSGSNPMLTHRHLGKYYPICNVGHADLVDTGNGEWYLVALASRIYGGYHKNMGRETFICPVMWENEWPIAALGSGHIEWEYPMPNLPVYPMEGETETDHFDGEKLAYPWNYIGTPVNHPARLADGRLYIRTVAAPIWQECHIMTEMPGPEEIKVMLKKRFDAKSEALGFVGRRQQHINYMVETKMEFSISKESETAGIVLIQNNYNQIRMEMAKKEGKQVIRVIRFIHVRKSELMKKVLPDVELWDETSSTLLGEIPYASQQVVFRLRANGQAHTFWAGTDAEHLIPVARNVDGSFLGSETSSGFIGAYIGMYASGNGTDTGNEAAFDYFTYKES